MNNGQEWRFIKKWSRVAHACLLQVPIKGRAAEIKSSRNILYTCTYDSKVSNFCNLKFIASNQC